MTTYINISKEAMDRQEEIFSQLVKEKQAELSRNKRWKKCELVYEYDSDSFIVYIYRRDCPMSAFYEYAMFHLLMSYADDVGVWGDGRWIPYAARAVSYLRRLPHNIRDGELAYFYLRAAEWYDWDGNDNRTLWHRKRGIAYQLKAGEMVLDNIMTLLYEMKKSEALHFCLYVMSHISEQGCFGEDEFYSGWKREHYVLVEYFLKTTTRWFVDNEECPVFIRSLILFLKAVYWKRTRRFALAETAFEYYLSLPESEEDNRCVRPDTVYALLGECYLHEQNGTQAKESFEKVADRESIIWEYVKSTAKKSNLVDELNQVCHKAIIMYCSQDNVTIRDLKKAIDVFFATSECE